MKRLLLLITIIANSILLNAQEFCLTGGIYKNKTVPTYNSPTELSQEGKQPTGRIEGRNLYITDCTYKAKYGPVEGVKPGTENFYIIQHYDTIFATNVVVNGLVEVRYIAEKAIVLRSNFHVKQDALFQAFSPVVNNNLLPYVYPKKAPQQVFDEETNLVSPIQETSDFSVSPNPAHDEITIHCGTPVEKVAIYNINGQIVLQSTQTQIDLSALSQGVYIVQVMTTDGQVLQAKVLHE